MIEKLINFRYLLLFFIFTLVLSSSLFLLRSVIQASSCPGAGTSCEGMDGTHCNTSSCCEHTCVNGVWSGGSFCGGACSSHPLCQATCGGGGGQCGLDSPACDAHCCSGITYPYGSSGYSYCPSTPDCSSDPHCNTIVWVSDVCRGNLSQGEYCRICEGSNYAEQVNKHLSGEECNAPCDAVPWMSGRYTQAQIEIVKNHCYIAWVNGWADRNNYENPSCIKVQRDAGSWRGSTWDYICHHFDEGGLTWPQCAPPPTNTPTPTPTSTSTPTPTPTSTQINISGRVFCQDQGSSTDYPIQGASLAIRYYDQTSPRIVNLETSSNGTFSANLVNASSSEGLILKLFPLPAGGTLSNTWPYENMQGPTGNTSISGCTFGLLDSLFSYQCSTTRSYTNMNFRYTNCEPPVLYPQCLRVEARQNNNPLGPAISPDSIQDFLGQQLKFACISSYPDLVSSYEFRVIKRPVASGDRPEITSLGVPSPDHPDFRNISESYLIQRGQYAVQCRICQDTSSSGRTCHPWDWDDGNIPWPPVPAPSSRPGVTAAPSPILKKCSADDCGKKEFECIATHTLQCLPDALEVCRWQCIPTDLAKSEPQI